MPMAPIEQIITWPRFLYTNFLYLTIIQPAEAAYFKTTTVGLVDGIEVSALLSSHRFIVIRRSVSVSTYSGSRCTTASHIALAMMLPLASVTSPYPRMRKVSVRALRRGAKARSTSAWRMSPAMPSVVRRFVISASPIRNGHTLPTLYPLDLGY